MNEAAYITAAIAYRDYGLARGLLRELAESGRIRAREVEGGGGYFTRLYCRADIEKFCGASADADSGEDRE